jgi:peroxiredoxin
MRPDIVPGAVFPDYELSDHRGKHRKLSELQGGDPLVLVLSRGGFCPKERRQHEGLLQLHREMQVGYCRLVTISTDNLLQTNEFRNGVGAHWTFLSDPARKLQKDLDIAEYTDPDHNPMIPYTLVLEPGLRVYKIYNGYWFFGRPTVEELRLDLRAVLQRCRPDWDITGAEHRTAWANGEKARFYPCDERSADVRRTGLIPGRIEPRCDENHRLQPVGRRLGPHLQLHAAARRDHRPDAVVVRGQEPQGTVARDCARNHRQAHPGKAFNNSVKAIEARNNGARAATLN